MPRALRVSGGAETVVAVADLRPGDLVRVLDFQHVKQGRGSAFVRLTLRNLLTKPGWNHLEVRTLRGVLNYLGKPDRR